MNVILRFFGATADLVGTRRTEITMEDGTSSATAFAKIKKVFPMLNDHKLHYAVNENYANGDEIIREGDELAIFKAVSGG